MHRRAVVFPLILALLLSVNLAKATTVSDTPSNPVWINPRPLDAPINIGGSIPMVYDSYRHKMVIFGGRLCCWGVTAAMWERDGTEWIERQPAHRPSGRASYAMAYDNGRKVTVLFGGSPEGTVFGDTWEWNDVDWVERTFPVSPPPRYGGVMTYDADRGVIVLFGGADTTHYFNDIWEYDGNSWIEKTPTLSPPARINHGFAFDPARNVSVLFGGTETPDTWEWDGTSWTERVLSAYPPSSGALLAYDTQNNVILNSAGQELWQYNGTNWTLRPGVFPIGGLVYAFAYDSTRHVGVRTGGTLYTYEYTGTQWLPIYGDNRPLPSAESVMVYQTQRQKTLLFGGTNGSRKTWEWDGTNWIPLEPAHSPIHRTSAAIAYDADRHVVVLFGGKSGGYLSDTWEWDGTDWNQKTPVHSPPPRHFSRMVYDAQRGVAVLYGGATNVMLSDVWEWDGTDWTERSFSQNPPANFAHSMYYDPIRQLTIAWGGFTSTSGFDFWEYDGSNWTKRTITDPPYSPAPRIGASLVYDPTRNIAVLYGGGNPFPAFDPTSLWEFDGNGWSEKPQTYEPPGRSYHGAVYDSARHNMVVFGGYGGNPSDIFNDTWEYGSSNTPPTIIVNNVTLEGNTTGGWVLVFSDIGSANDAEDGVPSVSCTPAIGSVLPLEPTLVTCTATDSGGLQDSDSGTVTIIDTTTPTITCPVDITSSVGQSISLGSPAVSDIVDPSPTVTNNAPATFPPGTTIVIWRATDTSMNEASCPQNVTLIYDYSGFFQPVDNPGLEPPFVVNVIRAGRGVAMKFGLSGNQGLNIFAPSYPKSQQITCDTAGLLDDIEETITVGSSSLSYDPATDQYSYIWKTNTAWAGTCRQFILRLNDGTEHIAYFQFR
jgi:hypothetical protein